MSNKYLSIYSLGSTPLTGVDIKKGLQLPMSFSKRFAKLTTEAAENAARLVLTQLTERLNFIRHQSIMDEEMECMQFGICSYKTQGQAEVQVQVQV